ncbi:hypothetical protein ACEPAH_5172 [Sanghuangporus vaninii]
MSNEYVRELCGSAPSLAEELAKDPNRSVDQVVKSMRQEWRARRKEGGRTKPVFSGEKDRLDRAAECGKFPYRPSELFLKVYADVLDCISRKPFSNLASPSVIGSSGVVPLSIVSVIPDIMRHYAELIANAQHEVFIATNYLENSHSSQLVSDALRVLSRRGVEEKRSDEQKIVVKIVYDRGTVSQIIRNHAPVPPAKWESVGLPRPEDLKGIRMEAVNYHRPPLGTFHAKYLIVDRKIACINSNNIQDRPNVEMCLHLEGPIVDSFYDVALFSWFNKLEPPLPLLSKVPARGWYNFGDANKSLQYIDTEFASIAARSLLGKQHEREVQRVKDAEKNEDGGKRKSANGDGAIVGKVIRAAAGIPGYDEGVHGKDELVGQHPAMNLPTDIGKPDTTPSGSGEREERQTGKEYTATLNEDANDRADEHDMEERQNRPRTQSETHAIQLSGSFSSTSGATSGPEVLRSEADSSSSGRRSRAEAITKHLNGHKSKVLGTVEDDDSLDDFQPHIIHSPHDPVPIAMVNRLPKGTPGHESARNIPQNVAWLSLLKNARKSVFIQTPTFNASPIIPATVDTCRRGVEVTLYLDLGFNDLGEMIPFQGGTNEQVVHAMYNVLNKEGKGENLKVYWYTAKDQSEPVSATRKTRNCHVKFMAVDSQVTMVGNGNQDTQSWFHSQEINLLIDSEELTREWLKGIDANQNTRRYGRVDPKDGVWRAPDGSGRVIESSGTKKKGPVGGLKGIAGAYRRARGNGGF